MANPTLEHNLDIQHGTLDRIRRRIPPLTYAYTTYDAFNTFFRGNYKDGGKKLKGFIVTDSEGNAGFTNVWSEDTTTIKSITKEYTLPYRHAKVSVAWNTFEESQNQGPEQIFDVLQLKYKAAMRDLVDAMYDAQWIGPSSASDIDSIYGISTWLPLGTDNTAGWTGYQSRYNDAGNTGGAAGTAFDTAGLTSGATTNARYASYYDDHNGNLDETLLQKINEANLVLNFQPPLIPKPLEVDKVTYAAYTSKNVILTLSALYAKLDSNLGPQPPRKGYYNSSATLPGGIPLVWAGPLNTQRDSIYGTDPIFGVNHNLLYPVFLRGWDFKITTDVASNRHLVKEYYIDWGGNIWCENRRHAGYQISKHPAS